MQTATATFYYSTLKQGDPYPPNLAKKDILKGTNLQSNLCLHIREVHTIKMCLACEQKLIKIVFFKSLLRRRQHKDCPECCSYIWWFIITVAGFLFCHMAFKGVHILIEDLLASWQTEGELRCALLENTYISSKEGNYSKTIGLENVRYIVFNLNAKL